MFYKMFDSLHPLAQAALISIMISLMVVLFYPNKKYNSNKLIFNELQEIKKDVQSLKKLNEIKTYIR